MSKWICVTLWNFLESKKGVIKGHRKRQWKVIVWYQKTSPIFINTKLKSLTFSYQGIRIPPSFGDDDNKLRFAEMPVNFDKMVAEQFRKAEMEAQFERKTDIMMIWTQFLMSIMVSLSRGRRRKKSFQDAAAMFLLYSVWNVNGIFVLTKGFDYIIVTCGATNLEIYLYVKRVVGDKFSPLFCWQQIIPFKDLWCVHFYNRYHIWHSM